MNASSESAETLDLSGRRDVPMLERLMRHPDWEMPEHFQRVLPAKLAVAMQRLPVGSRPWFKCVQLLYAMHEANRRAAPPPQEVNLNVSGDFAQAMADVARLTDEERAKLAEADRIFERLSEAASN